MVHSLRDGHSEVWICEFWVKENFWAQKPFVTDVYIEKFFRYAVHTTVLFDVFLRICVEFIKLFGYVRTYIAVPRKVNKMNQKQIYIRKSNLNKGSSMSFHPHIWGSRAYHYEFLNTYLV